MASARPLLIALLTLLGAALILSACTESQSLKSLKAVEVRDYEGQQLSSVTDFRENSIAGVPYIPEENYTLRVSGLVREPASYTYNEVLLENAHYEKVVTLDCVEGWSATILWQGVLVRDLIGKSQPDDNATTVIFRAYDGYTTSFPLDYIMENDILMAYMMNNVTLPAERGYPFQLVAEDKWGYKWIKWITEIKLSDDSSYKGYWETRGYSNTGNLNESSR